MKARPGGRRPSPKGFSLLEVVIAAGLLLMTVVVVTACISSVSRGGARLQAAMEADRAARAAAERLRGLPFCATAYPDPGASRGAAATDAVAAVFPHACASENTETARYLAAGEEGGATLGSFVTLLEQDGVEVRCVARFLVGDGGAALGPAELEGWSVDEGAAPPSAVLLVSLTAVCHGAVRTVSVTRSALATPPFGQPSPSVAGASW